MMKSFSFCALMLAALPAAPAGAYDKIEFKGQIINPLLTKPSGLASDGARVYVADGKANAVLLFEAADGKFVKRSDAQLKAPAGLAIGADRLYIADSGNSRVSVTDLDGKYLWSFSGKGTSPGQLSAPQALAFGPDERLYVANTGASSIEVFNADGIYLYGFPVKRNDGMTKVRPSAVAVDIAGNIFVSDGKALVQRYDRTGKLLREQEIANNGLAVHPDGLLYIVNAREGKVRELAYDGSVLGTFGTRGKGRAEFQNLCGAATDPAGVLYLCDDGNRKVTYLRLEGARGEAGLKPAALLARFTVRGPSGKAPFKSDVLAVRPDGSMVAHMPDAKELVLIEKGVKRTVASMGRLPGQVRAPRGVFAAADGKFFVADTGNDRVQVFKADGSFDSEFGGSGSGEGKFRAPTGLTVNRNANVYIADSRNKRVQAFSRDGIFLFAIGPQVGGLSLMNPVDVASDEKNNLYILDAGLKKVLVTDQRGKFLSAWDDSGALLAPASLVYDGKGFFYILDKGACNVKIFDAAGRFQASFFSRGAGDRELNDPQFLAYGGDKIHIADAGAARIATFDIAYVPEAPAGFAASAGARGVNLSWNPIENDRVKGYKVFRAPAEGGKWAELAYTETPAYEDASAEAGKAYRYRAAAVSGAGFAGEYTGYETVTAAAGGAAAARPAPAARDPRNVAPVEIEPVELNYLFSANYKRYLTRPVGRIAVRNNTDKAFSNVKISFHLRDYMDFPHDSILESIGPNEVKEVDLMATLNNRVLGITEDTPIQAQLSVVYYSDGQERTATLNRPIKVLSKNAIVWDRPERLATFITAKDTPVFAFSRYALVEAGKLEKEAAMADENLVKALFAWEALGEEGIAYLADPVNPYATAKSGAGEQILDTVQFPRTTLKIRSGDCDDLTALFASVFEAAGLRAALLDFPAHIAVMVEAKSADAREIGLPEDMLVRHNDAWWIPIETTMIGKDFYDAVSTAADMYGKMKDSVRVVDVRLAWGEFEPVTLPEVEARYEGGEKLSPRVKKALEALLKSRYEHMKKYYGNILLHEPASEDALINLGLLHAQYGENGEAAKSFGKLLEGDPGHAAALNNMGNLAFRAGDLSKASEYYHKASKADPFDAEIWLNQARAALKAGKKDDARTFAERAARMDASLKAVGDQLLK